MLRIFLTCSLFWLSASAWADSWSNVRAWYFNLGNHTEFYNAVQNDTKGGMRKFDFFVPTVGVGMEMPLTEDFIFLPEINWVPWRTYAESNIVENLFMFRADIGYDLIEWLRFRFGTGIMWANQQGKGGKTKMNNGSGQTDFYYPDENRSSINNTLDIGLETKFDQFAFRLQTYIYSVFKEERRQVSYTLFVTYYWEDWNK